jgi:hypothetical protein
VVMMAVVMATSLMIVLVAAYLFVLPCCRLRVHECELSEQVHSFVRFSEQVHNLCLCAYFDRAEERVGRVNRHAL